MYMNFYINFWQFKFTFPDFKCISNLLEKFT